MDYTGPMLRAARISVGLTLRQLAARMRTDPGYLSRVEKGKLTVTDRIVRAYTVALGEDAMDRRKLLAGLVAGGAVAPLVGAGPVVAGPLASSEWAERVETFQLQYWSLGAEEMRRATAGYLADVARHTTAEALAATSRLLALFAGSLPRVDGLVGAPYYYRMAVDAADQSGYEDRAVEARGRAAIALAQGGGGADRLANRLAVEALGMAQGPSFGSLSAHLALAHTATTGGALVEARGHLTAARRVFDALGSPVALTDYAMPEWRWHLTESRLRSVWGDREAVRCQELVVATAPASMARVLVQARMHRGVLEARLGDRAAGVAHAEAALGSLEPAKRSVTLGLVLAEARAA